MLLSLLALVTTGLLGMHAAVQPLVTHTAHAAHQASTSWTELPSPPPEQQDHSCQPGGGVCLATAPDQTRWTDPPPLHTVCPATDLAGRPTLAPPSRRTAGSGVPPPGGSTLLHLMCVSRT